MVAAVHAGLAGDQLATMIKRLEIATSRLEQITASAVGSPPVKSQVQAYEDAVGKPLVDLMQTSSQIDDYIDGLTRHFQKLFSLYRNILILSSQAKQPKEGGEAYPTLIKPLFEEISRLYQKYGTPPAEWKLHASLVTGMADAFGWLGLPFGQYEKDYVKNIVGNTQLYRDRIFTAQKEVKESAQKEWAKACFDLMKEFRDYYMSTHVPDGLTWNPNGLDLHQVLREAGASKEVPAPPPLPAASHARGNNGVAPKPQPDLASLHRELNRGADITSGLKKVDSSLQTQKNPSLRADSSLALHRSSSGSSNKSSPPGTKPKPESMRSKKSVSTDSDEDKKAVAKKPTASVNFDERRATWTVLNHVNTPKPIDIKVEQRHIVLIDKCNNATFRVIGKANAVKILGSKNLKVLIDSVVNQCEITACEDCQIQVEGQAPSIVLDQVGNIAVYLSKECSSTDVYTSKYNNVSVVIDDESIKDHTVPDMIKTTVKAGKFVSEFSTQ